MVRLCHHHCLSWDLINDRVFFPIFATARAFPPVILTLYSSKRRLHRSLANTVVTTAIWNLRNLCKAIFGKTQICGKILCMFLLKILKNRRPVTLYVKPRLVAVISLNI